ncbi:MAG: hypothetical protein WCW66_01845 [Patescibacteria group bacterium]
MNHDIPEPNNEKHAMDLLSVPDWHTKPGSHLLEFGQAVPKIQLEHNQEFIETYPEVQALCRILESRKDKNLFNGPLASVDNVAIGDDGLSISTKETDFFSYLASSYYNRDHVGENSVRPLSVQSTIFTPGNKKIILERRPESMADSPNKLSVFGGSIKPGIHPDDAILEISRRKLGLDLSPDQIQPSGLTRDNMANIFCVTYAVELTEEQYRTKYEEVKGLMRRHERMFYLVSTDEAQHSMEQILTGKRTIDQWDPNAFFNLLYALSAKGLRDPQELDAIVNANDAILKESPLHHTFPIEKYLGQVSLDRKPE